MRLEITRRAHLATQALTLLAERHLSDERQSLVEKQLLVESGAKLKGAELADRLSASPGFLAQAMTPLVNRGWVRSEPGPTGGYALVVDPATITARDVIEAVEGPTDVASCVVEDRSCADGAHCAVHVPWASARTLLLSQLEAKTLAAMATADDPPPRSGRRG